MRQAQWCYILIDMKIAICSDFFYPELSGISDSILLFAQTLASEGHEVMFVVPKYSKKDYSYISKMGIENPNYGPNISIKRLPSMIYFRAPNKQSRIILPFGIGLFSMIKWKPDVIYTQSCFVVGFDAFLATRILKVPLIGTNHTPYGEFIHDSPNPIIKGMLKYSSWYYNHCDYVTTPCTSLLDEMRIYGLKQKASMLPNPIALSEFIPVSNEKKLELKKEFNFSDNTILYTGRLATEKNIDVIIAAVAIAQKKIKDLSLVIAGHGMAKDDLVKLSKDLGIEDSVKFLGFVPQEKLPAVYEASDLFIIMSVAESQSLSLMQAMSTGLPVIGANYRALPEYIDKNSGFIVEPRDHEKLAEVICEIFENKEMAKNLGLGGIKSVAQYAPEIITNRWKQIYFDLLKK